jgi:hypothetical protein
MSVVKETEKKHKRGNPNLPKPGPGRPMGSKNKFTNLKIAFLEVFNRLGGTDGLYQWANQNNHNRGMFYQWLTKMLPAQVVGEQDDKGDFKPLQVIITTNGNKPDSPA